MPMDGMLPFTKNVFLQHYNLFKATYWQHTATRKTTGSDRCDRRAHWRDAPHMHLHCTYPARKSTDRQPTRRKPQACGPGGVADRVQTRGATGRPAAHIGNVTDPEGRRHRRSPSARGGFRCHLETGTKDNWGPYNLLPIPTWRKRGNGRVPTSISAKLSSLGSV